MGAVVAAAIGVFWCCLRIWASANNESPLLGLAVLLLPPVGVGYALFRFPKDYRSYGGNPWLVLLGLPFWFGVGFCGLLMSVPPSH